MVQRGGSALQDRTSEVRERAETKLAAGGRRRRSTSSTAAYCMVPGRPALLLLLVPAILTAQAPEGILAPPDSQHWTLEGRAAVSEYLGRTCLMLDGGLATLNQFEFRDGV